MDTGRADNRQEGSGRILCEQVSRHKPKRDNQGHGGRRRCMLLVGRSGVSGGGGKKKQHGKPTAALYLHVRSACLLPFLKLFPHNKRIEHRLEEEEEEEGTKQEVLESCHLP